MTCSLFRQSRSHVEEFTLQLAHALPCTFLNREQNITFTEHHVQSTMYDNVKPHRNFTDTQQSDIFKLRPCL